MGGHSHDGIDWNEWVRRLQATDDLMAPETHELVQRLLRPDDRTVVDVGAGAGGSAAAFAVALSGTGGVVTVVDSASELLVAAEKRVRAEAGERVDVVAVQADAASDELLRAVPPADLVFSSFAVHHLPDQQAGLRRLAELVRPGGRLVVVEAGLEQRMLPWDLGVGDPGLEDRLLAARAAWFREMRTNMEGSVRLTVGWTEALSRAGLRDVHSWSYLIERPPPASAAVLSSAVRRLERSREMWRDLLSTEDLDVLDQLLDVDGPHYLGHRRDVYLLSAHTVYVGTRTSENGGR